MTESIVDDAASTALSKRLQLVDASKAFHAELDGYMGREWGLADVGFNYNIVAVFGSQSTGKSTLLNRLFNTSFDVMDEHARQQTTKGIWLSQAPGHPTLVMDVEGTDGRERGDDQDFERKSSLFALAVAEVIIINMWEHMVGLYHGANMGLLKTVLEVNLSLFQNKSSPKTLIYFIIRDYIGRTPVKSLIETLRADMEKIWTSLTKPTGLENAQIDNFFDFAYATLPHKILMPEKFEVETAELSRKFIDESDPSFVFKSEYRKGIPADGFSRFAKDIWEQINNNRDLDLPSQQELLAQFRCDELSSAAFNDFTDNIRDIKVVIEAGKIVNDLGKKLVTERNQCRDKFDAQASRYHKDVYQRKRSELTDKIYTTVHVYFVEQLRSVHKHAISLLKNYFDIQLRAKDASFQTVVEKNVEEVKKYFKFMIQASEISDAEWSTEDAWLHLNGEIEEVVTTRRLEETDKMVYALEKTIHDKLDEPISSILATPSPATWKDVHKLFQSVVENMSITFSKKAADFQLPEEEIRQKLSHLKLQCIRQLKDKIIEQTSDSKLVNRMRRKFEQKFRYDDHGVPHIWQPKDDIESVYKKARDEAEKLLVNLTTVNLSLADMFDGVADEEVQTVIDSLSRPLASKTRLAEVRARFQKDSDMLFMEAKRSVVVTTATIPPWIIIVIAVLGWNEFIFILTSPLYLISLVMVAAGVYLVYVAGLAGPLLMVGSKVVGEVMRQVSERISDYTKNGVVGNVIGKLVPATQNRPDREFIEMKKKQ